MFSIIKRRLFQVIETKNPHNVRFFLCAYEGNMTKPHIHEM